MGPAPDLHSRRSQFSFAGGILLARDAQFGEAGDDGAHAGTFAGARGATTREVRLLLHKNTGSRARLDALLTSGGRQ